jgi:hypothetical protein
MIARCTDRTHKSWSDYGGRGVVICQRWRNSFDDFCDDVGVHPGKGWTLDRSDNAKGYEPGNTRWARRLTQNRNRRNVKLDHDKVTEAKRLHAEGVGFYRLGKLFGMSSGSMHAAVTGRTWKPLQE